MQNATLGLKSIFRSITSRSMLMGMTSRFSPSIVVNWDVSDRDLPNELFDACATLRIRAPDEYADLICALQEICDVAADSKSAERLLREVRDSGISERFAEFVKCDGAQLQNCAAWLLLNAPEAWERLLVSAKSLSIRAKTIEEYLTTSPCAADESKIPRLRAEFAAYLVKETLHGEHVHIETSDDGDTVRYLVSLNSFPTNVQQFSAKGRYALARDANATNFMLEFKPRNGVIRIKCPLGAPIRRELVRIFADVMLSAQAMKRGTADYDLSRHLQERILPKPNNQRIVAVRAVGLTVSFCNKAGTSDSLSVTTEGTTNLNQRMHDCLKAIGVADEMATVSAVEYLLTIRTRRNALKDIRARITSEGFHFRCRDWKEREIVHNYLTEVVS